MKTIPCKREDFIKLMAAEGIEVKFLSRGSGLSDFSFPEGVDSTKVFDIVARKLNFCDCGVVPHNSTSGIGTPGSISVNLRSRCEK